MFSLVAKFIILLKRRCFKRH